MTSMRCLHGSREIGGDDTGEQDALERAGAADAGDAHAEAGDVAQMQEVGSRRTAQAVAGGAGLRVGKLRFSRTKASEGGFAAAGLSAAEAVRSRSMRARVSGCFE